MDLNQKKLNTSLLNCNSYQRCKIYDEFLRVSCAVCAKKYRRKVNGIGDQFYCEVCLGGIFPFGGISSNREFRDTILGFSLGTRHLNRLAELRFNPLDDELKEALAGVDLTLSGCDYYDEDQFLKLKDSFI